MKSDELHRKEFPEYEAPPVTEVVIGVEFDPLFKFKTAHAGRYWGLVAERYPEAEQQPPLLSSVEKFGDAYWESRAIQLQMIDPEAVRHWLISADKAFLVQLQRDRFISNWRKVTPEAIYPRYKGQLRQRFIDEYAEFTVFLKNSGIEPPVVRQCEVTYVNDVPLGSGWSKFKDALQLISSWTCKGTDGFLQEPSNLSLAAAYDLPDQLGRLHYSFQRLKRNVDQVEVVQLSLTARGQPQSSSLEDIAAWLDCGREWVVRGFSDLTSKKAHQLWGRKA